MKVASCDCFQGKKIKFICEQVQDSFSATGSQWTWHRSEDTLNFCPKCGKPYEEKK